MLRSSTRPVVGSIRLVSRSRVRETSSASPAVEAQTIVRLKAWPGPSWMIAQAPLWSKVVEEPIQQQRQLRLMSSMTRNIAIRRLKEGGAKRPWVEEDLAVAPVLAGAEKLPSNLKLAVEAWPGKEDEVDGELHQRGSKAMTNAHADPDEIAFCANLARADLVVSVAI